MFETTPDYKSPINRSNRYKQNRELMKTETYTGLGYNFQIHDLFVTETAGSIQDRTRERLVPSDAPVVASRKVLMKAIQDVQEGREPPRMRINPKTNSARNIVSVYGTITKTTDWRDHCREKE
jgi:hypothetical protein